MKQYLDFCIPMIGVAVAMVLGLIGLTLNGVIAGQLQHLPF